MNLFQSVYNKIRNRKSDAGKQSLLLNILWPKIFGAITADYKGM